jgi:ApbE superfamily uncharacterized protein (UPF0280 family)
MYEERIYRNQMLTKDLVQFNVTEFESDLQIFAQSNLQSEARKEIQKYRKILKDYIKEHPNFLTSLVPLKASQNAPEIIKHMCFAADLAGVGPMAAVAGAVSHYVGLSLLSKTKEVILENGGDIYLKTDKEKDILIYAGSSPFSNKLALRIPSSAEGLGVCTSSGTIGHSLSFGCCDAVVVLSKDTLIADAAATSIGNVIKSPNHITEGLNFAKSILGVEGVVIIIGSKMAAWGKVNLVRP